MLFDCLCGENKVKECYKIGPVSPGTALSPTCPEKCFKCLLKDSIFPEKRHSKS